MSADLEAIRRAKVLAAEQTVIDSLPRDLIEHIDRANEAFAAKGGCWGCGSKLVGVHTMPCAYCDQHPFD